MEATSFMCQRLFSLAAPAQVAEECLHRAKDFSGLMLMHSAFGNTTAMAQLAVSKEHG